jgi:starch-binding outer membrane protein, SusD/RagB family
MKQLKFLFFITVISSVISCKKSFLDIPDKSVILRQSYVKDLKTMQAFLNGVYIELSASFHSGLNLMYPELIADNIKPLLGTPIFINHYSWNQLAEDEIIEGLQPRTASMNPVWFNGYRIIRSCSFVVEDVGKYREENTTQADRIKAQALSIRAFVHFILVNTFAQSYASSAGATHPGIPYIMTSDISAKVKRNTVAEVYDGMIGDLVEAISMFPPSAVKPLEFNQYAGKSLLARIFLFKGDFMQAKNLATEVCNSVPIMTVPEYPSNLFTPLETEALFQMPPAAEGAISGAGQYYTTYAGYFFTDPAYWFAATNDVADILRENPLDVRSAWVVQNGSDWQITKYPKNVLPDFPGGGAQAYYQTLLRSSETYLIAAEAFANLNNPDSAKYYLNAIRLRANSASIPVSASGAALLDSIYKERRKELAFEGLRMFDLQRWKKAVVRTDFTDPAAQTLSYPNDKAIAPLPKTEISISGLTQNPSY